MRRDVDNILAPTPSAEAMRPWGASFSAARVIATLEPLCGDVRKQRLRASLDARLDSVTLLMDAPHDPHNGAAVMRSCDAFGVQTLHVIPRTEPFLVSTQVTTGAERWLDVVQHASPQHAIESLTRSGYQLIATHPRGRLTPADLRSVPKLALVLGNEHAGIGAELEAAARDSVCIPMRGFVESLNMSVSAAVLLAAATQDRPGDLSPARREAVYAHWLYNSVARADDILEASVLRERAATAPGG